MDRLVNAILGMLVAAAIDMFFAKQASSITWVWNNFLRDLPMYLLAGAVSAEVLRLIYLRLKAKGQAQR